MIDRYARSEMKEIWTDAGRYGRWLEVELAVCDVLAERFGPLMPVEGCAP